MATCPMCNADVEDLDAHNSETHPEGANTGESPADSSSPAPAAQ